MVTLTRIYTRAGDGGQTRLGDMSRVSKLDSRLQAYADVDEANSHIGLAISLGGLGGMEPDVADVLRQIQNELFDVGADLCRPVVEADSAPHLRIEPAYIQRLERWCDTFNAPLPELSSFVLRGGTPAGAAIHVACTVTRRAERSTWAAIEEHGSGVNVLAASYLNRLSDLLFVLARYTNRHHGDVLWEPGRALDL
ncbi:cob(I)yrinic acid a,c-diamide adenosyltransferase [Longivirga aurantiaca]|uniref:Corrinoid adenosyltransferase n=1 Tax=Longivirga aurantiaca TaxID=1837743 RepID=A0ABW1SY64_9ACTN